MPTYLADCPWALLIVVANARLLCCLLDLGQSPLPPAEVQMSPPPTLLTTAAAPRAQASPAHTNRAPDVHPPVAQGQVLS